MTTTKALAKLYKAITGSAGRNSIAKILSDLADAWSGTAAGKVPTLPTAAGNYVLKVTVSGSTVTYSWVAES